MPAAARLDHVQLATPAARGGCWYALAEMLQRSGFRFGPDGPVAGRWRGHSTVPFGNRIEVTQS